MNVDATSRGRTEHLWIMALAAAAIVGSFALTPLGDCSLGLKLPHASSPIPVPGTCLSVRVLGVSCPGCGLTRSFVAAARGEFRQAFLYNFMGPVLFALCFLQIPYRAIAYVDLPSCRSLLRKLESRAEIIAWVVLAGLMISWVGKLLLEGSWLKPS